jgi:hypothetical protein
MGVSINSPLYMRHISNSDKAAIYFNTAPLIIGEGFCIVGILLPIFSFPNLEAFSGLLFLGIGIFLIRRKLNTMKFGLYVLTHGVKSQAEITHISSTNFQHNGRTVKEYNFQFEADGKKFNYQYQSANKRHLQIGNKLTIYYIKNNPKSSFIPSLYNINNY